MSNSGSGRVALEVVEREQPERVHPEVAAQHALIDIPWLFGPDVSAIFSALNAAGLTFRWREER